MLGRHARLGAAGDDDAAGVTEEPTTWDNFRAAVEAVHNPETGIWGAYFFASRSSPVTHFVPSMLAAFAGELAESGATDFTPVPMGGNPDEEARTMALLTEALG